MTNEMISVYFNIAIKIRRVCQRISDIFISFLLDDFFFRWPNIYSLSFCQDYAEYKCVQSFRIEGIVLLTYFRGRQLYIYIHFCTFSSSIVCVYVCVYIFTTKCRMFVLEPIVSTKSILHTVAATTKQHRGNHCMYTIIRCRRIWCGRQREQTHNR